MKNERSLVVVVVLLLALLMIGLFDRRDASAQGKDLAPYGRYQFVASKGVKLTEFGADIFIIDTSNGEMWALDRTTAAGGKPAWNKLANGPKR